MKHIDIVKKKSETQTATPEPQTRAADTFELPKQEPVPATKPEQAAPVERQKESANTTIITLTLVIFVIVALLAAAYYFYRSP